jgi:hypothetical protein
MTPGSRIAIVLGTGWLNLMCPYHRVIHSKLVALGATWVSSKNLYKVKDLERTRKELKQLGFEFM